MQVNLKITMKSDDRITIQEVVSLLEDSELTDVSHSHLLSTVLMQDEVLYVSASVPLEFLEDYFEGEWFDSHCGTVTLLAEIAPVELSVKRVCIYNAIDDHQWSSAKITFTGEEAFEVGCWIKNPNCYLEVKSIRLFSDMPFMSEVDLNLVYWDSLSQSDPTILARAENIHIGEIQ